MKNKKIHLFFAILIGFIFLIIYIFYVYYIYTSFLPKAGYFLAMFIPVPFILGVSSMYIFRSRLAKSFFIFGIILFPIFALLVPFSGDFQRKIFIEYSRLNTEEKEYKFISLTDTAKILENKNIEILSPVRNQSVRQCLLNENNQLVLLYALAHNKLNPFYSPDGYMYGEDAFYSPYVAIYDTVGKLNYTLSFTYLYSSSQADYLLKGNYIIDIYNYEYIDYTRRDYYTGEPMIYLENYDPFNKEDTQRSPITYYKITSDEINNFKNDGKTIGIFIKDDKGYYFFPPDDGTNYQNEKDEKLSMNYLLSVLKENEDKGIKSFERKNIIPRDFYYENMNVNGLFRDGKYKSNQIKWAQINLMFDLKVGNDTLSFSKIMETNHNAYNQLKTPTYYVENENETLEKYKDMIFYTNKKLSYSLFYDGNNIYMIKKEKK